MGHRRPKLRLRESLQKYKNLYGNPDKRPEKTILRKQKSIKKPNLIAIVGRFLPGWSFFPDLTRIKPLSVHRLSTVMVKYQG